jgi:DNA-binding IclR family transcriptional regulator
MTMYDGMNVKQFISPILDKLFHQTGESIFLTILDKDEAVTLEAIEPDNKVKFSVSVGSRAPLYVGASYRSIFAFMPEDFIENYLETKDLKSYTKTDKEEIRTELKQIKKQGWAISEGEFTPDIIAIAVPLFDKDIRVIGSVTVSGPVYRMTNEKINEYLPLLVKTRDEMANMITKFPLKVRV